jgi:hypothetical protein
VVEEVVVVVVVVVSVEFFGCVASGAGNHFLFSPLSMCSW